MPATAGCFAKNKLGQLQVLKFLKSRQPNIKIVTLGGLISTELNCASYINRFGTSKACANAQNVRHFFNNPSEKWAARYQEVMAITDLYIDKISLACHDGTLESCDTETADGHPMFVDRHHLTLPYARMLGERYLERHPNWYAELLEQ